MFHSSTASDRCWIGAERLLIIKYTVINVEGGSQRNLVHIEEVNSMCEIQWTSPLHVLGGHSAYQLDFPEKKYPYH